MCYNMSGREVGSAKHEPVGGSGSDASAAAAPAYAYVVQDRKPHVFSG